jgi:hypothetical protein
MRQLPAIAFFLVSMVSGAFAQQASWTLDHGHAADAIAARRAAATAAAAKAAAIRNGTPLTPSQATDFSVNGGGSVVIDSAPLTSAEQKAELEGRAAWEARCRPTVVEDRDGMRRTRYAQPDCDLSRFNTAGAQ